MGTTGSKVLGTRRGSQAVAPRGSDLSASGAGQPWEGGQAGPAASPRASLQASSGADSPIKMYAAVMGKEGVEGGPLPGATAQQGSLRARHGGQQAGGGGGVVGSPTRPGGSSNGAGAGELERSPASQEELMRTAGPRMPEKWQRGDTIGTGSFGSVFIGLNNLTGEQPPPPSQPSKAPPSHAHARPSAHIPKLHRLAH